MKAALLPDRGVVKVAGAPAAAGWRRLREDGVEVVGDGDLVGVEFFHVAREEGGGADEGDFGAEVAALV